MDSVSKGRAACRAPNLEGRRRTAGALWCAVPY